MSELNTRILLGRQVPQPLGQWRIILVGHCGIEPHTRTPSTCRSTDELETQIGSREWDRTTDLSLNRRLLYL